MTLAFSGRVESAFTVPSGGAACSVSTGALTAAVTVTTPAATYYHTAAGGISSWATTFQTALNAAVSPYPDNAASMAAAVGYGTWTAGWGFNIASGNDTGLFGGVTLTAASTPSYGNTGPGNGGDLAVGFDSSGDLFDGGANFDVGANDLCVAWVGKFAATPSADGAIISKLAGAAVSGYEIYALSTGNIRLLVVDGGGLKTTDTATTGTLGGEWHVGIAVVDRSTGKMRVGTKGLTSGTAVVSSETTVSGNITTAGTFRCGTTAAHSGAPTNFLLAGAYIGTGSGCATGLSTNLSTALTNFASAVSSAFTVSLSTTTGLYTISNSFYPFDLTWTDTNQRDIAGYDRNITYPQTAAQLTTALGGYGTFTSGAGYLCNETSGNLAAVFGTPSTLTAASTPTYSNLGPRGGTDKAVGFDSTLDAFTGTTTSFDVAASDDLFILLAVKFSTTTGNNDIAGKGWGAGAGYGLFRESGNVSFYVGDGVDQVNVTAAVTANVWNIVAAVVDRSAATCRVGVCPIGGSPTVSSASSTSAVGSMSNVSSFALGQEGVYGAGNMTVGALYIATGSSVATGMSANLSTILSSFAAYMKSQTSTAQAKALWIPGSPLNCDDHPSMYPDETDTRGTESPTGVVLGLSGNVKYAHSNVRWDRVAVDKIREASATYANASLETFFRDAVSGQGHAWLRPYSPLQLYWSSAGVDTLLGCDANSSSGVAGWSPVGVAKFKDLAVPSQAGYVGQFNVRFPRLVSSG